VVAVVERGQNSVHGGNNGGLVVAIEVMVVVVVAAAPASAAVAGVNERGLWCALAKTLWAMHQLTLGC